MDVSSCNSVNSLIMYNMKIMTKISFVITLIPKAIIIIYFDCFEMSLKSNVAVYQGHINFRKEVSKHSQSIG